MNECGECGKDFGSVSAFDAHRVGVHEYTFQEGARREPTAFDGRRCLSESEMRSGVAEEPIVLRCGAFVVNAHGSWSLGRGVERARARFGGPTTAQDAAVPFGGLT